MNINSYFNDLYTSILITFIIIFGTKLTNYYYNFYHIYKYLDYDQKLGYFRSNYLVNIISKYPLIKKIIVYYFLIPIIKLNYLFISIFITLLYSLCYNEFKNVLDKQYIQKFKNKMLKKKTFDFLESKIDHRKLLKLDENNNYIESTNNNKFSIHDPTTGGDNSNNNLTCGLVSNSKNCENCENCENYVVKNEITNVDKIDYEYDNKIFNIMELISMDDIDEKNSNNKIVENIEKKNTLSNDIENNMNNSKLNLLNEIDLLKLSDTTNATNDKSDTSNNKSNYLNFNKIHELNKLTELTGFNLTKKENNSLNYYEDLNGDINDYLVLDENINTDNANNTTNNTDYTSNSNNNPNENIVNLNENTNNKGVNLMEYKKNINLKDNINKIDLKENNETINFEDVDFGMKLIDIMKNDKNNPDINLQNVKPIQDKKIIKIGKKKNKSE